MRTITAEDIVADLSNTEYGEGELNVIVMHARDYELVVTYACSASHLDIPNPLHREALGRDFTLKLNTFLLRAGKLGEQITGEHIANYIVAMVRDLTDKGYPQHQIHHVIKLVVTAAVCALGFDEKHYVCIWIEPGGKWEAKRTSREEWMAFDADMDEMEQEQLQPQQLH